MKENRRDYEEIFYFRAASFLEEKGFSFDEESIKHFSDGRVLVIYAKEQIGGFAIHLMQK